MNFSSSFPPPILLPPSLSLSLLLLSFLLPYFPPSLSSLPPSLPLSLLPSLSGLRECPKEAPRNPKTGPLYPHQFYPHFYSSSINPRRWMKIGHSPETVSNDLSPWCPSTALSTTCWTSNPLPVVFPWRSLCQLLDSQNIQTVHFFWLPVPPGIQSRKKTNGIMNAFQKIPGTTNGF